jgi:hypothetical protein
LRSTGFRSAAQTTSRQSTRMTTKPRTIFD